MIPHRSYQIFGLKEGKITHISAVQSGLSCICTCPHCKIPLIAKKGMKNIHHFAHVASSGEEITECGYGNQTALHLIAKEILLNEKHIILPKLFVSAVALDVYNQKHSASKVIPPYKLLIESVEDEVVMDGIIPDIVIKTAGKELLVEIVVTNLINERKRNWLKQRDKAAIQIDLSSYYKEIGRDGNWDADELRHNIVDSVASKSWIFNPKKAAIYNNLFITAKAEADKVKHVNITFVPMVPRSLEEVTPKEGVCRICGEFIKESDWWFFDCATKTCECKNCLRRC